MALVDIPHIVVGGWWGYTHGGGAAHAFGTSIIDHLEEKVAYVFRAPVDGTINSVGWTNATPTAGTLTMRVSLQDIDASGHPDGVVDQYRTGTLNTAGWMESGLLTDDGTDTGVKRTVSAGDYLAVVFDVTAYTSGSFRLAPWSVSGDKGTAHVAVRSSAGSWSKTTTARPNFLLEYATLGIVPIPGVVAATVANTYTYNSGSASIDERALRFSLAAPVTIAGVHLVIDEDGDFDVVLYEGTTVRASVSVDVSTRRINQHVETTILFTDPYDLAANTVYRVAIKPTTATSLIISGITVDNTGDLVATGGGANWYMSHRIDAGAWSDVSTDQPNISLVLSAIDDGTSTGSSGVPMSRVRTGM